MGVVPAVVFPDAAALASNWIGAGLKALGITAEVGLRDPRPMPQRAVVVVRTGGPIESPVTEAAQLTFNCYGPDDAAANQLAQTARAILYSLVGVNQNGVMLYRIAEVQGPQYLPSPATVQPRYIFTLRLSLRGTPLDESALPWSA